MKVNGRGRTKVGSKDMVGIGIEEGVGGERVLRNIAIQPTVSTVILGGTNGQLYRGIFRFKSRQASAKPS